MKKSQYQKYFQGKKITVMGIGLLGRNVGDIKFMAENGAQIIATDLKSEKKLKKSLIKLKKFKKNIQYTLERHLLQDFQNRDFIIKGSGVSLDNKYIEKAKKEKIPVYMSLALVLKILKEENIQTTFIGVTGTKGKSTTTALLTSLLEKSGKRFHLAGNIRGIANLPLLKKIKDGDIILAELDSWQLQGFHNVKISPQIAVFTNFFEDHLNYYKGSMKKYFYDKSAIFKYQSKEDFLIMTNEAKTSIYAHTKEIPSAKKITATFHKELKEKHFILFGKHNEKNIALAYQVGKILDIDENIIFSTLTKFKAIEGRFQYVDTIEKIHFYNDNNSTTPESTLLSLKSLKNAYPDRNIIWIGGGADKGFSYKKLTQYIEKNIYFSILFSGGASAKIKKLLPEKFGAVIESLSMKTAVGIAFQKAKAGDVIILSPGAASFGVFKNEYERNDQFLKQIKILSKKNKS